MSFVPNYSMPKKMRTGYVEIVNIGGRKLSITNRNTNKVTIIAKAKKKRKLHLLSHQPT